jgi:hypothetical protein
VSSIKKLPHPNAECRLWIAEFNLLLNYKKNWGRVASSIWRVPKQKLGRLSAVFHKREGPGQEKD